MNIYIYMAHYEVNVHTVCATLSEIVLTLRIPQLGKNIGGNRLWALPVNYRGLESPKCEDNFFGPKMADFWHIFKTLLLGTGLTYKCMQRLVWKVLLVFFRWDSQKNAFRIFSSWNRVSNLSHLKRWHTIRSKYPKKVSFKFGLLVICEQPWLKLYYMWRTGCSRTSKGGK